MKGLQKQNQNRHICKRWQTKLPLFILLFILIPFSGFSQSTNVKGKVVDQTGQPVTGASVMVKGGNSGVSTNASGNFEIKAPGNSMLLISSVGFTDQEVKVNGNEFLNVTLNRSVTGLNEVVVIGYGSQRKEAITGSVSSISAEKLSEVPSSNISNALQGRLPGVQISQTSTKPGSTMQILIRGRRSISASNDPLIVLDGIPFGGSFSDIDPENVKSITVLKDASATAIYGSRGANGVILITTKKGAVGQKAHISYNSYYGIHKLWAPFPMMNGPEFDSLRVRAGIYKNGTSEAEGVSTDWQKLFYRPSSPVTNQNIDVSGGSAKGSYHFGLGYYDDQSLIPTQAFKRFSINSGIEQGIGNYIRLGFSTNTNYSISNGSQVGIYNILSMSPLASPYNADGSLRQSIQMPLDNSWNETRHIVDSLKNQWLNPIKTLGTYNNLYGILKIPGVQGLSYRINVGLNYRTVDNGSYTGTGITSTNATTPSVASIGHSVSLNKTIENLLTYDRTFASDHHLTLTALYSAEQDDYNSSNISAQGVPNDQFQFYNLGQALGQITINPAYQGYSQSGLESWMGRAIYEYAHRYMLTAVLRTDGSSRLAAGHQWHTYPAISAGWNIANERFMKNVSFFNELKVRVGYGETSNQAVAPYSTLGQLTPMPYNFGPTNDVVGYYVSQLPSPNLGWEYSKTWNYGLDFSILKNRLSGTIEYYITKTNDLLLGVALPATTGVPSYTANVGNTQNKGLELSLNGTILSNHNGWTWTAGVNVYGNRNKLVSLASGQTKNIGNNWFVGYPLNVIYDYKKIGLWQAKDANMNILEPGGNVGMIKVQYTGTYDNGVPTRAIGPDDQQIQNLDPKFQGGFSTNVSYKEFDFAAVGLFQNGGMLISTLYSSNGYLNLLSGRRNNVKVDYWTPATTNATYPKPGGKMSGDNPIYGSTLGYFNASYLKVQTLSLGYNFANMNWAKNAGITRARLYFMVQNPFVLFSPYYKETGMDPQTNSYGDQNAAVPLSSSLHRILTVGTNTPETRNYLLGINLTF